MSAYCMGAMRRAAGGRTTSRTNSMGSAANGFDLRRAIARSTASRDLHSKNASWEASGPLKQIQSSPKHCTTAANKSSTPNLHGPVPPLPPPVPVGRPPLAARRPPTANRGRQGGGPPHAPHDSLHHRCPPAMVGAPPVMDSPYRSTAPWSWTTDRPVLGTVEVMRVNWA